tara:strand:+ start:20 stop:163 length:144 start_codon:yes stop_codon:yes gene_type:complete
MLILTGPDGWIQGSGEKVSGIDTESHHGVDEDLQVSHSCFRVHGKEV